MYWFYGFYYLIVLFFKLLDRDVNEWSEGSMFSLHFPCCVIGDVHCEMGEACEVTDSVALYANIVMHYRSAYWRRSFSFE